MYSIWLSLKENIRCSPKPSEVFQPERSKCGNRNAQKVSRAKEFLSDGENLITNTFFCQKHGMEQFNELNSGDASRNVIEMIFQASSKRSEKHKHTKRIDRVLKVKNSPKALERFERYREMVKKNAAGQGKQHPRSTVDGNELLMFYVTTMTCCPTRKSTKVSDLCWSPSCRVCRIIQSGFGVKGGDLIRLSASCDVPSSWDDEIVGTKGGGFKKAVVVCRVIAGRVANVVDSGNGGGFDSLGIGLLDAKLEHLFVRDPSAVLPCFVIVCA